jgi:hypothetical protein
LFPLASGQQAYARASQRTHPDGSSVRDPGDLNAQSVGRSRNVAVAAGGTDERSKEEIMSEPAATEADALEQQRPAAPFDDGADGDLDVADAVAATDEADEADRAEQGTAVPLDEDDYR